MPTERAGGVTRNSRDEGTGARGTPPQRSAAPSSAPAVTGCGAGRRAAVTPLGSRWGQRWPRVTPDLAVAQRARTGVLTPAAIGGCKRCVPVAGGRSRAPCHELALPRLPTLLFQEV